MYKLPGGDIPNFGVWFLRCKFYKMFIYYINSVQTLKYQTNLIKVTMPTAIISSGEDTGVETKMPLSHKIKRLLQDVEIQSKYLNMLILSIK